MDKIKNLAQILSSLEMSANDKKQLINYLNDLNKEDSTPSTEMDIRYKPNSSFMTIDANQYIDIEEMSADDENFENKKNEIIEKINKGIDSIYIKLRTIYGVENYKVCFITNLSEYGDSIIFCYRINSRGSRDKQHTIEIIEISINSKGIKIIKRTNTLSRQLNLEIFIFNGVLNTASFMDIFNTIEDNKIIITNEELNNNNMYNMFIPFTNDIIDVHFYSNTFNYYITFKHLYSIDNKKCIFEGKLNDKIINFEIDYSNEDQCVIDLAPFIDYVNSL